MGCNHTGRYKYRFKKTWFSGEQVILQVEVSCTDFDPLKGHYDTFVFWRDAVPMDLTHNSIVQWTEYIPALPIDVSTTNVNTFIITPQ